jgi:hypothetical protein
MTSIQGCRSRQIAAEAPEAFAEEIIKFAG